MSQDENSPDSRQATPEREERRSFAEDEAFFNKKFEETPQTVAPGGELCGGGATDMYVATAGTGVAVTMYDTELKLGGMCYVLLPDEFLKTFPHFDEAGEQLRKRAVAPLEACIADMKRRGAGKHRIQIRLIGGGKIPGTAIEDAGTKNYIFVREYIVRKGLGILNEDLGGSYIRRVHFFPATGRTVRMVLRRASDFVAMLAFEKNGRDQPDGLDKE